MARTRTALFVLGLLAMQPPAAQACDMHERGGFGAWARMQYAQKLQAARLAAPASRKSGATERDADRDQANVPVDPSTAASGARLAAGSKPEPDPGQKPIR